MTKITLTLTLKDEFTDEEAISCGSNICDHLFETFNDDNALILGIVDKVEINIKEEVET